MDKNFTVLWVRKNLNTKHSLSISTCVKQLFPWDDVSSWCNSFQVCTQTVSLPSHMIVTSACAAAGHLSGAIVDSVCSAPYQLTLSYSDQSVHFWSCQLKNNDWTCEWFEWTNSINNNAPIVAPGNSFISDFNSLLEHRILHNYHLNEFYSNIIICFMSLYRYLLGWLHSFEWLKSPKTTGSQFQRSIIDWIMKLYKIKSEGVHALIWNMFFSILRC